MSAILAVLATTSSAPAASVADRAYAIAAVEIVGRDGKTYDVFVSVAGRNRLDPAKPALVRVLVERCPPGSSFLGMPQCITYTAARFAVPDTALTIAADLGSARLNTTFAGHPLTVTWRTTAEAHPVPTVQVGPDPIMVRTDSQRPARATVSILGARCVVTGSDSYTGEERRVTTADIYEIQDGKPPAALNPPATKRCRQRS